MVSSKDVFIVIILKRVLLLFSLQLHRKSIDQSGQVYHTVMSLIHISNKALRKRQDSKIDITMLDIKIYIFTVLTEAHTRMPKKPTRSTKSRITFLIFVHKL